MASTSPLACRAVAVATALSSGMSPALSAEVFACPDPLLTVQAGTAPLAERVCEAAAAKALLLSCGLSQPDPIRVEVVPVAVHPGFGACVAVFDPGTGCLQVTEMERLATLLPATDARGGLPPEADFAPAIAHAMAHALVQQSAAGIVIVATEQEFVASAIETETLDPALRAILLEADPVAPGGALSLVHLGIYGLAPRAFANNAWLLFRREEMGCALIRAIVAGAFQFPRR